MSVRTYTGGSTVQGRPRTHPHIKDANGVTCKICSKCDKLVPLINYGIQKSTWDGYSSECRFCRQEDASTSRHRNDDPITKPDFAFDHYVSDEEFGDNNNDLVAYYKTLTRTCKELYYEGA